MKAHNSLQHASSPYLLQHAANPVQWHIWGDEALQLAKENDKPILLSIGYSSCHWCHVMAHESFENETTAALMNEHFINIKVDREERPDLDHIYMNAIQILTGSGGWPLNVFLTPDLKPFYGGTYFPPKPLQNRASWNDVLWHMADAFKNKRDEVEQQAQQLLDYISNDVTSVLKKKSLENNLGEINFSEKLFSESDFEKMFSQMQLRFDSLHGGFEAAPKFLGTMNMEWLLMQNYFFNKKNGLEHVQLSLTKMLSGGIYDQLGGGISRYSTDAQWFAPHFEKMLYDNALMLKTMAQTFLVTKDDLLKTKANHILQFLKREMQAANGGFYSALDADSEGVEGKFYGWQFDEIKNALNNNEWKIVQPFYNITTEGNWEHGFNILHQAIEKNKLAEGLNLDEKVVAENLKSAHEKLFSIREKKIRPQLDNKQLLAWNALLISGLSQCYKSFGDDEFKNCALQMVDFFSKKLSNNFPNLYHQCTLEKSSQAAFLDDYAFAMQALLDVYAITFDEKYLQKSYQIAQHIITHFSKPDSPFFYFTAKEQTDIISRSIELYDGALPSPNSVICRCFLKLSVLFNDEKLFEIAQQQLAEVKAAMIQYPTSFANWACASMELENHLAEIICCGENAEKIIAELQQHYLPASIMLLKIKNSELQILEPYPMDKNKIFVCRNKTCEAPVIDSEGVLRLLKNN